MSEKSMRNWRRTWMGEMKIFGESLNGGVQLGLYQETNGTG